MNHIECHNINLFLLLNLFLFHQIVKKLKSIEYGLIHIEILVAGQPPHEGHTWLLKETDLRPEDQFQTTDTNLDGQRLIFGVQFLITGIGNWIVGVPLVSGVLLKWNVSQRELSEYWFTL